MNRRNVARLCLIVVSLGLSSVRADEPSPLFPFAPPWDDASPGAVNVSAWNERPAGKHGPITVKDGHLYAGDRRIRLFGVNLCFGANFPSHADAARIAARMAKFGINAVRFHHMDNQSAPGGILARDRRSLDPGQLDKLDFLIAELKKQGIYADLNLHVSREYPDAPRWEGMPSYFKGVDQFDPKLIDWQKRYARELLTHQNPYTKTKYIDEPAVALIEINNENALLHEWWGGGLDAMPPALSGELARQWNAWLTAKYPRFADLRAGWGATDQPLGQEMLANGSFRQDLNGWVLERHGEAQAEARPVSEGNRRVLAIQVTRVDGQDWHVQLAHPRLAFQKDRPYTLQFRARASSPRKLSVNAMQAHDPYRQLWSTTVDLTADWKDYQFTFAPGEADDQARITFSGLGRSVGGVQLAEASLRPGGVLGLRDGESEGKIGVFLKRDFGSRTAESQRDWIRFLWDTERDYWTGMAHYLRDALKVRGLIVGTQMGWSPFPIQAELDVIDSHSYWQHPHFPGRPWDMNNWLLKNIPMTAQADGGTLPRLALSRVAGKPFICTEYNHASPNEYSGEAFPLIAAEAAMQDWDGIFAFAYCHRTNDWGPGYFPSFFDIDQHPTKMALLPASAALFTRGDVHPPAERLTARASLPALIDRVRLAGPYLGADAFGVDRAAALRSPVAIALDEKGTGTRPTLRSASAGSTEFLWHPPGQPGLVLVNTARSRALLGAVEGGNPIALEDVSVAVGPTRNHWATLAMTALDGPDFHSPGRLLITAAATTENTGMGWKDAEHTTVGRDWGKAPSLVEGVPATITLPVAAGRVRAWALDDRGQRRRSLTVAPAPAGARAVVTLSPEYHTLWYEVEIAR